MINEKIRKDKTVKGGKIGALISAIVFFAIFGVMFTQFSVMISWQKVLTIVVAIIALGICVACFIIISYQKEKIKQANASVIKNGLSYLKSVLDEIKDWRQDYKTEDAVNDQLISLLN